MASDMVVGKKFDAGKARWDLMPMNAEEQEVLVLTFGTKKYSDHNWKKTILEMGGVDRYFAAGMRHLAAFRNGELRDPESGLLHTSHASICFKFISWFLLQQIPKELIKAAEKVRCLNELKVIPGIIKTHPKTERRLGASKPRSASLRSSHKATRVDASRHK